MQIRGQVFHRTSRLTAEPVTIFAPGAGFWDTMTLAGVGSGGGAGGAGGDVATEESAAGVIGDVADGAMLTLPSRNPASCKTRVTPPSAWPVKLGIKKCLRWCGFGRQQTDLGRRDTAGIRRRTLAEHLVWGCPTHSNLRDCAHVQSAADYVDLRGTLAFSEHVGNLHSLRPQTLGDSYLPAPPHLRTWGGELRKNLSLGNRGTVVLAFDVHLKTAGVSNSPRLSWSFAHQIGDGHLTSMNGKTHRG